MRLMRLIGLILIVVLGIWGPVSAQEATDEPDVEATEPVTDPEMTEEPATTDDEAGDTDSEDTTTPEGAVYIVQPGDTLFRIAVRFRTTTSQLATANGIVNPSLIYVGQRIVIPGAVPVTPEPPAPETPEPTTPEPPTPSPSTTYIVQPGDTLFRIAIRNGTSVSTLVQLNPSIVNASIIFVGQRITLPDGASVPDDTPVDTDEPATETPSEPVEIADFGTGIEIFVGDDLSPLVSQTTQMGVDWVKLRVNWADVQPAADTFEWQFLDDAVTAFDDAGFNILLTLTGTPDWARPGATELALQQATYGPPDDLSDFGTFAGAVAERYAGTVDGYEIWEQPNNRLTWMKANVVMRSDGFPDVGLSETRYIDLLEAAYDAIKAADADATVITAGLAPTGNNDYYNSIDNFIFFEDLLRQGGLRYADAMGIHVDGFSNAPDATCCGTAGEDPAYDESYHFFFTDTIENYRTILNRRGGTDVALWVTRFGWGTEDDALGEPTSGQGFISLNTPQEQADYTAAAFVQAAERGDIGPMILYNLNGCSAGLREACFYSVIDANGSARPVFNAILNIDLPDESE